MNTNRSLEKQQRLKLTFVNNAVMMVPANFPPDQRIQALVNAAEFLGDKPFIVTDEGLFYMDKVVSIQVEIGPPKPSAKVLAIEGTRQKELDFSGVISEQIPLI